MKRHLLQNFLISTFYLLTFSANSQTWAWATEGNSTTGGNFGMWVDADPTGNVFQTGYFNSSILAFGTYSLTKLGSQDMFITKYNANGNVMWSKSSGATGGTTGTSAWSVASDALGNAYVTGMFGGSSINFGSFTLNNGNSPNFDLFLVKYDPNGNVLWAKSAGGSGNDYSYSVDVDASGNCAITGAFESSSINFGSTTLNNSGTANIFVAKYDANGNALWAKSAGGSSVDRAYGLAIDAVGNVFATGYFNSSSITFGTVTLNNSTSYNVFLTKYDPSGNVLWAKGASRTASTTVASVTTDGDGNAYITGSFAGSSAVFGTFTLTNNSSAGLNTYIVKYDVSGNVVWAKSIGGTTEERGISICAKGGDLFVSGLFGSSNITIGTFNLSNSGPALAPIFIAQYDLNGNVIYATRLASGGVNTPALTLDNACHAYITGGFTVSPFLVGSNTLTLSVPQEEYIARLNYTCQLAEIKENANEAFYFQNQPNPASGKTTVYYRLNTPAKNIQLTVYDAIGNKVEVKQQANVQEGEQKLELDLKSYSAGLYYYSLNIDGMIATKKLLVD